MYTMLLRLLSPEVQTLLRSLQLPVEEPKPDEDADVGDVAAADDEEVPPPTATFSGGEAAGVDDWVDAAVDTGVDTGATAAADDWALEDPGAQPPFAHTLDQSTSVYRSGLL